MQSPSSLHSLLSACTAARRPFLFQARALAKAALPPRRVARIGSAVLWPPPSGHGRFASAPPLQLARLIDHFTPRCCCTAVPLYRRSARTTRMAWTWRTAWSRTTSARCPSPSPTARAPGATAATMCCAASCAGEAGLRVAKQAPMGKRGLGGFDLPRGGGGGGGGGRGGLGSAAGHRKAGDRHLRGPLFARGLAP